MLIDNFISKCVLVVQSFEKENNLSNLLKANALPRSKKRFPWKLSLHYSISYTFQRKSLNRNWSELCKYTRVQFTNWAYILQTWNLNIHALTEQKKICNKSKLNLFALNEGTQKIALSRLPNSFKVMKSSFSCFCNSLRGTFARGKPIYLEYDYILWLVGGGWVERAPFPGGAQGRQGQQEERTGGKDPLTRHRCSQWS